MAIVESVLSKLQSSAASEETIALWMELFEAFEEGGPEAVKELLSDKVKGSKRRADKEMKGMRAIAGAVDRPKGRAKK